MKSLALIIAVFLLGLNLSYGCTSINLYNATVKAQSEGIVTHIIIPVNITGSY